MPGRSSYLLGSVTTTELTTYEAVYPVLDGVLMLYYKSHTSFSDCSGDAEAAVQDPV